MHVWSSSRCFKMCGQVWAVMLLASLGWHKTRNLRKESHSWLQILHLATGFSSATTHFSFSFYFAMQFSVSPSHLWSVLRYLSAAFHRRHMNGGNMYLNLFTAIYSLNFGSFLLAASLPEYLCRYSIGVFILSNQISCWHLFCPGPSESMVLAYGT